jgi:hypothetical protein
MNKTVNSEQFGQSHLDFAQEERSWNGIEVVFLQLLAHGHNLTSRPAERAAGGGTKEIRNG